MGYLSPEALSAQYSDYLGWRGLNPYQEWMDPANGAFVGEGPPESEVSRISRLLPAGQTPSEKNYIASLYGNMQVPNTREPLPIETFAGNTDTLKRAGSPSTVGDIMRIVVPLGLALMGGYAGLVGPAAGTAGATGAGLAELSGVGAGTAAAEAGGMGAGLGGGIIASGAGAGTLGAEGAGLSELAGVGAGYPSTLSGGVIASGAGAGLPAEIGLPAYGGFTEAAVPEIFGGSLASADIGGVAGGTSGYLAGQGGETMIYPNYEFDMWTGAPNTTGGSTMTYPNYEFDMWTGAPNTTGGSTTFKDIMSYINNPYVKIGAFGLSQLLGAKSQAGMMEDLAKAQQQSWQDYLSQRNAGYSQWTSTAEQAWKDQLAEAEKSWQSYLNAINPEDDRAKEAQFQQAKSKINETATEAQRRLMNTLAARGIKQQGISSPLSTLNKERMEAENRAYWSIYGKPKNIPNAPMTVPPNPYLTGAIKPLYTDTNTPPVNYAPSTMSLLGKSAADVGTMLLLSSLFGK